METAAGEIPDCGNSGTKGGIQNQSGSDPGIPGAQMCIRDRTYTDSTKLEYAQKFTIDNYEGGYSLITITDGGRFLVVPEDKERCL